MEEGGSRKKKEEILMLILTVILSTPLLSSSTVLSARSSIEWNVKLIVLREAVPVGLKRRPFVIVNAR